MKVERNSEFYVAISHERNRQIILHGEKDEEASREQYLAILVEEVGEVAKAIQEGDNKNMLEELVQVATVCMAMYCKFKE